ncbi:ABC transporter ATP-binding protein [Streptomyces formicae]|uniref:ABC transporter ATP-binding protein n=2 Tax=Streptomyces formicae TaxID=1616117 RepID=UPI0036107415
MPDLHLRGITKQFTGHRALHDLSLTVHDGEIFTLLGPSGCGKSTTLWSIAGLHRPDSGSIAFGDRVVYDHGRVNVEPEHRNCGVVFQSYAIWPHMSVYDNVGYPLKLRKVDKARRDRRIHEVLELVELGRHAKRYPHELSGGQQQRVALARALAHPPDMLLLDEPFSNLDAKLRDRSRQWLKTLQEHVGVTTVFVTHDQDEALSVSDRIAVLDRGRVRQIGTPTDIYENPADLFVADFVGTANILPATVTRADGHHARIRIDGMEGEITVPHTDKRVGPVRITIRPENIEIHRARTEATPAANTITAKVDNHAYLGDHLRYSIRISNTPVAVTTTRRIEASSLTVSLPAEDIRVFHEETSTEDPSTEALSTEDPSTNEENHHASVR